MDRWEREMKKTLFAAASLIAFAACTTHPEASKESFTGQREARREAYLEKAETRVKADLPAHADPALDAVRSKTLSRFRSERDFFDWMDKTAALAEARGHGWMRRRYKDAAPVAMAAPEPMPAAPPPASTPSPAPLVGAPAPANGQSEQIYVTASAPDTANPEITNNQIKGVDEGSIVKQVGSHLIVLQDGRLFVTDLKPGGADGLKLTDRANVYRSSDEDTWYDEMLVAGRNILVTGYSYNQNATEFTVLTLSPEGKVSRNATFYISSEDYYSDTNFATRMINGKLVIHTPVSLAGQGWWDKFDPPVIREWRPEGPGGERLSDGTPLFQASNIWRPVQRLTHPVIHTVTVCDILGVRDGSKPTCQSTALVGSERHEFLVTEDAFWLWMAPSEEERDQETTEAFRQHGQQELCTEGSERASAENLMPGVLARLPINGARPSVMSVKGMPQNQFAMDKTARTFRALIDWQDGRCDVWDTPEKAQLAFFDAPLSALSASLREAPTARYVPLPSPGTSNYEARFTERHLVYGARSGWGTSPPEQSAPVRDKGSVTVIDVARPEAPLALTVPHDVIRAERAGPYMALTGYRDHRGLSVSLIDLRTAPRTSDTLQLPGRFESENRSHAFNSRIDADGAGLIGLPVITDSEEADRYWWWSQTSDLGYLATDAQGRLKAAGQLNATRTDPNQPSRSGYECEVSCVDWYGNARPIFSGGRIFALINTELVEGHYQNGAVREVRRIDLTGKLPQ
jgi:hypothetical protein